MIAFAINAFKQKLMKRWATVLYTSNDLHSKETNLLMSEASRLSPPPYCMCLVVEVCCFQHVDLSKQTEENPGWCVMQSRSSS